MPTHGREFGHTATLCAALSTIRGGCAGASRNMENWLPGRDLKGV
jgi:hypothetical protein